MPSSSEKFLEIFMYVVVKNAFPLYLLAGRTEISFMYFKSWTRLAYDKQKLLQPSHEWRLMYGKANIVAFSLPFQEDYLPNHESFTT